MKGFDIYAKRWCRVMTYYKNFFKFVKCVLAFFLMLSLVMACDSPTNSGRKAADIDFPKAERGYPKSDIVMINGKSYAINIAKSPNEKVEKEHKMEIELRGKDDIVDVALPQWSVINYWSMEESLSLISNNVIEFPIDTKDMLDGTSNRVQRFRIKVADDEKTTLIFKWSNVNEMGKAFKDKKADYILKITVSHENQLEL
ncbi:hypothetical protein HMPREF0379_1742 [[Eubacterium] yurii subsp. margaretiae ATCC 43715]|nr:hypothetical protein HMPREF0379_1742 [[Eubacterium] yurii subsp. margaretiae ATCC 43715]